MGEKELADWISQSKNHRILTSFSVPKTTTQVRKELNLKKFNLKPFLNRQLIQCLNPETYKGRLYALTNKSRKLLKISNSTIQDQNNWDVMGWIMSSPKQRSVVLKTLAMDSVKRTSEDIRKRASNSNPCLSRISTKDILKELANKELIETEIREDRKRYYWISEEGKVLVNDLIHLLPEKSP